jgi:predicted permease
VSTGVVSWNFFDVLGVRPHHRRSFLETDERHGADAVLVLSHDYWQRSFGGDARIVGRTFQMNDRPHQVVGVLPPVPDYPLAVDVYMPTSACPFRSNPRMAQAREGRMMTALARVKPGVTLQKTQADLAIVAARLQHTYPDAYPQAEGYRAAAVPLQEELTRGFRRMLLVLLGTAGFVLLIVCASVANLMLARTVKRERELAVRTALGASRARLLRQLLTESTLLALAGGLVGLAIAACGVPLWTTFAERYTPHARDVEIDRAVLLYTFAVAVATGLIFGSVPAFHARRPMRSALAEDGRATHEPGDVRDALIVVQVAASLMLLIGAGLTIRSLYKLQQVDPGFRTDNILTMRVDLNFSKYTNQALRAEFWRRFEDRLTSLPGVVSAGGAATFPLNEEGPFSQSIRVPGREAASGAPRPRGAARVGPPA